jgi:hypothetical protein
MGEIDFIFDRGIFVCPCRLLRNAGASTAGIQSRRILAKTVA